MAKLTVKQALENLQIVPDSKPSGDRKYDDPGRKAILIDGVKWGEILMSRHGSHGTSYTFHQEAGSEIQYQAYKKLRGGYAMKPVKVWGDKHYMRVEHQAGTPVLTLEQRLENKVRELITEKKLRHPDDVRAGQQREHEAYLARQEAARKKEEEKLRERAAKCLSGYENRMEEGLRRVIVGRIVEAMQWAQSQ